MNILFLGDIVASPGRKALADHLPGLRKELNLDCVIANGENAAHGRGITIENANEIFAAGVDVITLGDHTFDQKGAEELLAAHANPNGRIIRPANYPHGTVGKGHTIFTTGSGKKVGVINLQGRVFMKDLIDDPFRTSRQFMNDYQLGQNVDALVIDIHAEATSEKCVLGHLWDGKASLVVGTHTHIPTADTRIQPLGTAFQADAGMCGFYESSLGMSYETSMPGFERRTRIPFQPASGPGTLCGVLLETLPNGLAKSVKPLRRGGTLQQA